MFRRELARVDIFKDLDSADLDRLAPLFDPVDLQPGQVVFQQGTSADFLYILLEGKVVVNFKPYDGPLLTVANILPGGIFGWSAVLGRQIYNSTAVAACESTAIRIKGDELRTACERYPATGVIILETLASAIAERLESTRAQIFTMLSQSIDLSGGQQEAFDER